jgi:hypothetical protein
MLTHMHNVIHLVVNTFDQGWRSLWSEKVFRVDRTLDRTLRGASSQHSRERHNIGPWLDASAWRRSDTLALRLVEDGVWWHKAKELAREDRTLDRVRSWFCLSGCLLKVTGLGLWVCPVISSTLQVSGLVSQANSALARPVTCGASGRYLRHAGAATSRWHCAANVRTRGTCGE